MRVIVLISTLIYNLRRDYIISLSTDTGSFFLPNFRPIYSHLAPSPPLYVHLH